MWPFKKKEETVESLIKDCNKLYSSFNYSLTLAHYQSYYEMKKHMKENFQIMRTYLGTTDDEKTLKELLLHFKEQLKFFQENAFACPIEKFQEFSLKHLPYEEKIKNIVNPKVFITQKHKM